MNVSILLGIPLGSFRRATHPAAFYLRPAAFYRCPSALSTQNDCLFSFEFNTHLISPFCTQLQMYRGMYLFMKDWLKTHCHQSCCPTRFFVHKYHVFRDRDRGLDFFTNQDGDLIKSGVCHREDVLFIYTLIKTPVV
jgi:hypothetical protein